MPDFIEGDPETARIAFVIDHPSDYELMYKKPMTGPAGHLFNECLEQALILRSDCYLTTLFKRKIHKRYKKETFFNENWEPLFTPGKKAFSDEGFQHVLDLDEELKNVKANIILPLGPASLKALCNLDNLSKWRGSIMPATLGSVEKRKTIPTYSPANILYKNFVQKYVIAQDLKKAYGESFFPELVRPKYKFRLSPTFNECLEVLEFIKTLEKYTCDIEIGYVGHELDPKGQCTRIAFCWNELTGISIPYADGNWSEEQEAMLWLKTAEVLEMEGPLKIFHNGCFDIQFLMFIHGIMTAPPYADTMVSHHIVYPDFPKSLAFCASLHTKQPFWKDMVKHANIENPEG